MSGLIDGKTESGKLLPKKKLKIKNTSFLFLLVIPFKHKRNSENIDIRFLWNVY